MIDQKQMESAKTQMRRGVLEFAIMLIISRGKAYSSDILEELKVADLLVVEGTLYPLLSRLRSEGLLAHQWEESKSGPPRKYYSLTDAGKENLKHLKTVWSDLEKSINTLIK